MESIIQSIYSFFACLFFAIIYNTPKKDIVYCGITGGIGYGIYYIFMTNTLQAVLSTFMGTVAIVLIARIISVHKDIPVMLYILPAIFPLVPGANMYYAMYGILTNNVYSATSNAITAFKLSGITVIAMLITMSLPVSFFAFARKKTVDESVNNL